MLPPEWRLAGFAAASAITAMGGPMQDIPTAVLRQTRIVPEDRAAAMRGYMAIVGLGVLIAMLFTPAAIARFGITPVIVACGVVYLCVAAVGLARFAQWREAPPVKIEATLSSVPAQRSAC
jgi:MFS transporter, DHA3 family, macrolide efflux protein